MKKILLYSIYLVIIVACFFLGKYSSNNSLEKCRGSFAFLQKNNLQREFEIQDNAGYAVNNFAVLNNGGQQVPVSEIAKENFIFILRFSFNHCSSCIENAIIDVETISKKYPKLKVFYLCNYKKENELDMYSNIYGIARSKLLGLVSGPIHIPFEDKSFPYGFIIDKSLTIKYFFIPSKSDKQYNVNVLNYIAKKFMGMQYSLP